MALLGVQDSSIAGYVHRPSSLRIAYGSYFDEL